jgi:hypothetical protein
VPTLTATPAQLAALDAYIAEGSQKGAAYRLRVSQRTIENHLAALRVVNGMATPQLVAARAAKRKRRMLRAVRGQMGLWAA